MPPKKAVSSKGATGKTTTKAPASKGAAKTGSTSKSAPKAAAAAPEEKDEPITFQEIVVKQLDSAVMADAAGKIKESGKCALVIDPTGTAATFFRYRDANFLEILNPDNMEAEKIRLALIGAIRYGKPVVIDLLEMGELEPCIALFDNVQKDLLASILNQSFINDKKFATLVKDSDGDEYAHFEHIDTSGFKFIILTRKEDPSKNTLKRVYPIKVVPPS